MTFACVAERSGWGAISSVISECQSLSLAPEASLSREPRIFSIRDNRKSLKHSLVRQNARVCQRKPSNAMAWGAIHRQRGSGLDRDWYFTSISSDRRMALTTERSVTGLTPRTGVGADAYGGRLAIQESSRSRIPSASERSCAR